MIQPPKGIAMTTTDSITAVRVVDGTPLPAAGRYEIDPSHSSTEFVVRHLGLARVRGRFASFSGTIEIADEPADSSVEVAIETASVDTRDDKRDEHLRSADFFESEAHPQMTFRSASVSGGGEDWKVQGDLTIRGVSRPVTLDATLEGMEKDPWGNDRVAFSATTELNREDFGLTWNQALESGGLLVSKKVRIEIEVSAVRS
jgi:polyisoprenoid-binding protein YceI